MSADSAAPSTEAMDRAILAGGKIVYHHPADGSMTLAYLTGVREGWWKYGRGVFNGDCIDEYAERHWKDYLTGDVAK